MTQPTRVLGRQDLGFLPKVLSSIPLPWFTQAMCVEVMRVPGD